MGSLIVMLFGISKKKLFFRGMLNSFSLEDDLDEIAKISADVLAIALGLR